MKHSPARLAHKPLSSTQPPSSSLSASPGWQAFAQAVQAARIRSDHLRLIEAAGLRVDLSAQYHSPELARSAGVLLAQQGFEAARRNLFEGGPVNWTEQRPAWHTALRALPPPVGATTVLAERARLRDFVQRTNQAKQYRHIVHLGIGGSDWGPRLVVDALGASATRTAQRTVRFAANIDAHAITTALTGLDPRDTLIIIASKSFTTTEPLTNAACALAWLRRHGIANPTAQLVAVTANAPAALAFGIDAAQIFTFPDWVGGRYSVWSSLGLTIALGLGLEVYEQLLAGASELDQHFRTAPIAANAPVQMALATVANRSVLGFGSLALAPYDARLRHFIAWVQQLEMESLGKTTQTDGTTLDVPASVAVWGMPGTDCQHTFFQWLHQDGQGAPVDFLLCARPDHDQDTHHATHHRLLIANCLAQRAALARGKTRDEAYTQALDAGESATTAARLAAHRSHPGGRPSTLIVLPRLTAHSLGALLALYEHKVFTQGVLWGLNPFDQWGVEYGKTLAHHIAHTLDAPGVATEHDASTAYWIEQLAS